MGGGGVGRGGDGVGGTVAGGGCVENDLSAVHTVGLPGRVEVHVEPDEASSCGAGDLCAAHPGAGAPHAEIELIVGALGVGGGEQPTIFDHQQFDSASVAGQGAMVPWRSGFSTRTERSPPPPASCKGMLMVAPEAVVIPNVVPPLLIHPVSGCPSPSTSITCLVVAPVGTPLPVGTQPEVAAGAAPAASAAVAMPVVGGGPVGVGADPVVVVVTVAVEGPAAVVGAGVAVGVGPDPQAVSSVAPNTAAARAGRLRAVRIVFS